MKSGDSMLPRETSISVLTGLCVAALLNVLAATVMGDGQARWAARAALAGWAVTVIIIVCRRTQQPTRTDHLAMRWGSLGFLVLTAACVALRSGR